MLPAFVFTTNELAVFCKHFSFSCRLIITRSNPTRRQSIMLFICHKLAALVTVL